MFTHTLLYTPEPFRGQPEAAPGGHTGWTANLSWKQLQGTPQNRALKEAVWLPAAVTPWECTVWQGPLWNAPPQLKLWNFVFSPKKSQDLSLNSWQHIAGRGKGEINMEIKLWSWQCIFISYLLQGNLFPKVIQDLGSLMSLLKILPPPSKYLTCMIIFIYIIYLIRKTSLDLLSRNQGRL